MHPTRHCQHCGVNLAGQVIGELCANCLLKLALEGPPLIAASGNADLKADKPAEPNDASGTQIGRYTLREKIGEGGCGVVYVAEQTEPVRRQVALKVIKLGMDTKAVVGRFEGERQALALMDHPNIAKVLDGGATESGRPFFVMELVRGIPITVYCERNNVGLGERLKIFIQVCQAVQHAHQKGIIHRDIKPSNILVTVHDGVPVPKVIDFGIARATAGRLTDATVYTQLHQFLGTPAYMSPEQAEMTSLDIDTRSDIYSLGVLLYELLTGTTPFDGKECIAAGIEELRRLIREQEPPRPSTRLSWRVSRTLPAQAPPGSSRPCPPKTREGVIPADLDWIAMKCLEKDRTRRYETANGLAVDLQRFLRNEVVSARPPSPGYRLQKAWRRNRLVLSSGLVIAAILAAATVISSWQAMRATKARLAEHNQRIRAETNEQRALISEDLARLAERRTRERLYAADMAAVGQTLREGNFGQAREYLRSHIPALDQEDMRGFEWRHYWHDSAGEQWHTFEGHTGGIFCLTFSPDGRLVASGSSDRHVFLWDIAALTRLCSFEPGGGEIRSVTFNDTGDLMAVGTERELSLWSVRDPSRPELIKRRDALQPRVLFLRGRSHLVLGQNHSVWGYGFEDGFTEIWDYETGETIRRFPESGGRIALTGDQRLLITGVRSDLIHQWDLRSDRPSTQASFPWPLRNMAASPNGRWLITNSGEEDNRTELWDAQSLSRIRTLLRHEDKNDIWNAAFSPDSRFAATTHSDQLIRIWNMEEESPPRVLRGHGSEILAVAFSPNGRLLASGANDQTVRIWDLEATSREPRLDNVDFDQWQQGPAFSPDGTKLAIGGRGATVELWNVAPLRRLMTLSNTTHVIRFSPDGSKLITMDDTVTMKAWDLSLGVEVQVHSLTNETRYRPYALSPNEQYLASAAREPDDSSTLIVWNVQSGEAKIRLKAHHRALWAIQFFPDGERFVTCGEDRAARIWNLRTLEPVKEFTGHANQVFGIALSPDASLLATASIDATAKVWNIAENREIWTLKGHKRGVLDIVFNADGKTLATCSDDGSVRLWNLATGRQVGTWQGRHQTTWAVFSPDGSRLAIVDASGTARILTGPPEALAGR